MHAGSKKSARALDGVDSVKRDAIGRFKPGNPGGPGRPPRVTELSYLRQLSDAVPLDAWQRITAAAVELAANGDKDARAWLSTYLLPQPIQGARPLRDLRIADGRAELAGISGLAAEIASRHIPPDGSTLDERPTADARRTLAAELTRAGCTE